MAGFGGRGTQTVHDERTETAYRRTATTSGSRTTCPADKLTEAMVMGTPVIALCGKVWVPSRDPQRFPVCPECKDIWESLKPGDEDSSGGDAGQGSD